MFRNWRRNLFPSAKDEQTEALEGRPSSGFLERTRRTPVANCRLPIEELPADKTSFQ